MPSSWNNRQKMLHNSGLETWRILPWIGASVDSMMCFEESWNNFFFLYLRLQIIDREVLDFGMPYFHIFAVSGFMLIGTPGWLPS